MVVSVSSLTHFSSASTTIGGVSNSIPTRSSSRLALISCLLTLKSTYWSCRYQASCSINIINGSMSSDMMEMRRKKSVVMAGTSNSVVSEMKGLRCSRVFLDARNEDDLLFGIKKATETGKLPSNVATGMVELYQNYRKAVLESRNPKAGEIILSNMAVAFDRIFMDMEEPFDILPHHKAIREPFDYYMFFQNYIRPLIDFRSSCIGNVSLFYEIEEKLHQGENILFVSNHQTEADPAIIALLLERTNPNIAENITYVAGDRVTTDPLCRPFSMGRNLMCVYSKKHVNDVPELAEWKKQSNSKTLKKMAALLRDGTKIIWSAPSGGRDRPDPITKELYPAPFDVASVDNMRRLLKHAGIPSHIYPFAILCYDILPPPPQVEKDIGEKRVLSFHGAGLSVAPEINFNEIAAACVDPEQAKKAYACALFHSVNQQYNVLKCAIHGNQGLKASTPAVTLSQPWN